MTQNRLALGTAVFLAGAFLGVVATQAFRSNSAPNEPSARTSRPTLQFSNRVRPGSPPEARRTSPGPPGMPGSPGAPGGGVFTDGREKVKGAELHVGVKKDCNDPSCQFTKCSALCTPWISETYAPEDFENARHKNQIFFNCVGACIDPTTE